MPPGLMVLWDMDQGLSGAVQREKRSSPVHLVIVAIEKGDFRSTVGQVTLFNNGTKKTHGEKTGLELRKNTVCCP